MDSLEKIAFPTKTRIPITKSAETLEDFKNDLNVKVKKAKIHNVKPNFAKQATNEGRDERFENDDNYEVQHPKIKTKELYVLLDRFNDSSKRFEQKMVEEDEANFSTTEGFNSPAFETTESCSEDDQWEIIQVPYSTKNRLPNITNFQNVLTATADELDVNKKIADSTTNDARSDSRNQDNRGFTINNLERNDNLNKKVDYMNLEEMVDDMSASEILMEEIESQRLQAGRSTMTENDIRKLTFEGIDNNQLRDDRTTSSENQNNSNHFEELLKRIEKANSSREYSHLKRCRHPDRNSDLLPIKTNRSKLNVATRKYSVTSCSSGIKSKKNEQKELRAFVTSTMNETHPDLHFKDDVALRLQTFLWDMLHRIGDEAENLVMLSSRKVFDKRVLKYAIKLSLEKMKNEADVVSGKRNQWLF